MPRTKNPIRTPVTRTAAEAFDEIKSTPFPEILAAFRVFVRAEAAKTFVSATDAALDFVKTDEEAAQLHAAALEEFTTVIGSIALRDNPMAEFKSVVISERFTTTISLSAVLKEVGSLAVPGNI